MLLYKLYPSAIPSQSSLFVGDVAPELVLTLPSDESGPLVRLSALASQRGLDLIPLGEGVRGAGGGHLKLLRAAGEGGASAEVVEAEVARQAER